MPVAVHKKEVSAQEPRRLRTRAALLSAGMTLLGKRPIEAIAIDEIVQEAGVAKGSFFNHFEDKAAFAVAIAHDIRERVEEEVTAANDGIEDPALRVVRGVSCVAQFARKEPTQARILMRVHGLQLRPDHPLNRGLKSDLELGLAKGQFKNFAAAVAIRYVIGLSHMVVESAMSAPNKREAQRRAMEILALLLKGLGLSDADAQRTAQQAAESVIY
jgi:AcrR family transcriptional regulator